jgi:TPR repeat protein
MKIIPSNLRCVLILVGLVYGSSSFAATTDALEAGGIYPTVPVAEVTSSVPPAEEGPAVPTTIAVPGGPGVPRLDADPAEVEGFLASLESVGDGGQYAKEQARSKLYEHATTFGNLSAVKALAIAAERGDFMAQGYLCITFGRYLGEDIKRAGVSALKCIDKIRAEVSRDNPYAQWILGKMYESGIVLTTSYGILDHILGCIIGKEEQRRLTETSRLYQLSAAKGYVHAQFSLGEMYYYGIGMAMDKLQGVAWWRKAADLGFAEAQFELGDWYENGAAEVVAIDHAQAAFWYRKAAEQYRQSNLTCRHENGTGEPNGESQAAFWRAKAEASAARSSPTEYCLGWMYENAAGIDRDEKQAIFWYEKAEKEGYAGAIEALSRLRPPSSRTGGSASSVVASAATGVQEK